MKKAKASNSLDGMTENQQDLYNVYLQKKTVEMCGKLKKLEYGDHCSLIVPSPILTGFRNRAKFKIFHEKKSIRIMGTDPIRGEVPAEDSLWIIPEWGRACVREIYEIISDEYQKCPVDGFEIQLTHGRQECHVILSVKKRASGFYEELSETLIENITWLKGVAVPSLKMEFGEMFLKHSIFEWDIFAHYLAFFQSNFHLIPKLLFNVRSSLNRASFKRIVDLYCGVGFFSLNLRAQAKEIFGVDSSKWAVESAVINGKYLDLNQTNFKCTSVEKFLDTFPLSKDDVIFLNPPRQGVSPVVIETIASQRPHTICLVSCSLETHLRDLKLWRDSGYSIRSFAAFDMFPFTNFLETVTVLES
ncbi:MAG: methyltransferase [Candidatus Aminicenantes bacterium]|nr:methyltransferase [Candidatus Aminicenantes bacterium]